MVSLYNAEGKGRLGFLTIYAIGDVTVGLRKKGRNVGPKHTKILVTHLDQWTPRQGM